MAKDDRMDLLIKEITVLNGKINICLNLFERLENRMIGLSMLDRDIFRKLSERCKKDYDAVRDVFVSFDKEIVDDLTEMEDGEL